MPEIYHGEALPHSHGWWAVDVKVPINNEAICVRKYQGFW